MTVILATGDVGAKRANLDSMFDGCRDALAAGDVVFGQLETTITDRGARAPQAKLAMRAPPALARAVREAGYDVMSVAGNHCLDWGYEGFADTLSHMAAAGVETCGGGNSIIPASKPSVLNRDGIDIAFIACSSILPEGYWATNTRAGCMPMRAHTIYEQVETDQPGTPARIITHPHRQDLAALLEAIRVARDRADIVLLSIHWGLHMTEATIADYQRTVGHAAIDAGAHAVIGHHPHILKGVEVYKGAAIFYSLGNFAIEQPHVWDPDITKTESFRHLASLNSDWDTSRVYMLPEDTRMTGIAKFVAGSKDIHSVEFLPAWIDDDSVPRVLDPHDERFARVRNYLQLISESQGLATQFVSTGTAIRISA